MGLIPFSTAMALEQEAWAAVSQGGEGRVLGFESESVITLGVRGTQADIEWSAARLHDRGFAIHQLERGGQATLHHPGQLVIFPILNIREIGVRAWIELLLQVTTVCLAEFDKQVRCQPHRPGLFSSQGKVVSVGVRVRQGISTHGLSINVCNDLADFTAIRPCGVSNAPMDRVGPEFTPEAVFCSWVGKFQQTLPLGLTSSRILKNLECSSSDVRL